MLDFFEFRKNNEKTKMNFGDSLGAPDQSQHPWDMIYHHPPSVLTLGGRRNSQ